LAARKERILDLARAVGSEKDLQLFQWAQLMAMTWEFEPDLVIELGRGHGNSTCAFTEAMNGVGRDVVKRLREGRMGTVLNSNERETFKREIARYWDRMPCNHGFGRGHAGTREFYDQVEREKLSLEDHLSSVAEFGEHSGDLVLEIGCGLGTMAINYARHGASVIAVDMSRRSVGLAQGRFKTYGLPGGFCAGDGESLPFHSNRFDFVVSWGVIHHTPGTGRVISEIHRVLKPGGVFLVMVYYKYSATYLWDILFKKGIVRGEWLKRDAAELLNKYTEAQWNSPLTKVYSIRQAKKMFARFEDVWAQPHYIFKYKERGYKEGRRESRFVYRHFPNSLYRAASRLMGWHLVIKGRKPVVDQDTA
jgi:ubiquinone/menaquinone biosynthesis C-methylase UbiE